MIIEGRMGEALVYHQLPKSVTSLVRSGGVRVGKTRTCSKYGETLIDRPWHNTTRLGQPQITPQHAVGAVLPDLDAWVGWEVGRVIYRLTQILTGHGYFGEYLNKIGLKETTQCNHGAADLNTAERMLESKPEILVGQIRRDLSPPAIIAVMLKKKTLNEIERRPIPSVCSSIPAADRATNCHRVGTSGIDWCGQR